MNRPRSVRALAVVAVLVVGLFGASGASATNIGDDEGCTPGFWKNNPGAWEEYNPDARLDSVFTIPAAFGELADDTLLDALSYKGGPESIDKAKLLLHHAVAAILNAAHEGIGYPFRRDVPPLAIIPTVNSALAGGDVDVMSDLKDVLDAANNLGCPLAADESSNSSQASGHKLK